MLLFGSSCGPFIDSRLVWCNAPPSIVAPKEAQPVLHARPEESALLGVDPAWNWGIIFRRTLLRHDAYVDRCVADARRRWIAAERERRRIRGLPASVKASYRSLPVRSRATRHVVDRGTTCRTWDEPMELGVGSPASQAGKHACGCRKCQVCSCYK